jgi:hypothetical protein
MKNTVSPPRRSLSGQSPLTLGLRQRLAAAGLLIIGLWAAVGLALGWWN